MSSKVQHIRVCCEKLTIICSSDRTSHPVGTTVRVADFLKHIPVRRQTALKGASKTLTKIKKMLHAYAIAQPSRRLSFKVLKSKNESSNWTYGPKPNATLVDAALMVAGPEIVSHCTSKVWPSEGPEQEDEAQDDRKKGYKLVALLPKADAGNDIFCYTYTGAYLTRGRFLKGQQLWTVSIC